MKLSSADDVNLSDIADQVDLLAHLVKTAQQSMHLLTALLERCSAAHAAFLAARGADEELPGPLLAFVGLLHGVLLESNNAAANLAEATLLKRALACADYTDALERAGETFAMSFGDLGPELTFDASTSDLTAEFKAAAERDRAGLLDSSKDLLAVHHTDLYRDLALDRQDVREALAALDQRIDDSEAQDDERFGLLQQLYTHMRSAISRNSGVSAKRSDAESALESLAVTSYDFDEAKGEPIGRGGFAQVVQATWIPFGTQVAIKRLLPPFGRTAADQPAIDLVAKEALVWSKMRHRHVMPLLGVCLSANMPFLVMPYMDRGELSTYAAGRPAEHLRLLTETAMGMAYLHSKNVLHGGLKANNVLVDGSGRAQVADFGLSRVLSAASSTTTYSTDTAGNVRWMAPERYKRKAANKLEPDVFSFAMLAFEVVAGQLPFHEEHELRLIEGWIRDGDRPNPPTDSSSFTPQL
ncbi:hypothetical protein H9P43_006889 [Blastocladiella emersonii ATCC 22665]|nr:hypothetical protein H9P43_006889 [Blastocladiella emersonii ATCC 22665]